MCVISMIHDHFNPLIPDWPSTAPAPIYVPVPGAPAGDPPLALEALRKLIDDFRKASEAAKVVDRLTGQSDCLDPEKAKLLERIERLEKVIDRLLAQPSPAPDGEGRK